MSYIKDFYEKITGVAELKQQINLLVKQKEDIIKKLEAANSIIYNTQKTDYEKALKITELESQLEGYLLQIDSLHQQILAKQSTIESLKYQLAKEGIVQTVCPSWLDENKQAYKPYLQIPKTNEGYPLENPRDIYLQGGMLERKISAEDNRKLSKYEKLIHIWKYTIDCMRYISDIGDNWQPHITTIARGGGDCEDGTVVFIDSCRSLGIKADEVFNAVGPTSFGYHSYPIVWLSEEDVKETNLHGQGNNWYIFEATLNYYPSKPLKLKGSSYWVDNVANWKYAGEVENKNKAEFNGKVSGSQMTDAAKKIKRGKQKRKRINEYWKKVEKDDEKDKKSD